MSSSCLFDKIKAALCVNGVPSLDTWGVGQNDSSERVRLQPSRVFDHSGMWTILREWNSFHDRPGFVFSVNGDEYKVRLAFYDALHIRKCRTRLSKYSDITIFLDYRSLRLDNASEEALCASDVAQDPFVWK